SGGAEVPGEEPGEALLDGGGVGRRPGPLAAPRAGAGAATEVIRRVAGPACGPLARQSGALNSSSLVHRGRNRRTALAEGRRRRLGDSPGSKRHPPSADSGG